MKKQTIIFLIISFLVISLAFAEIYIKPDASTIEPVNQYYTTNPITQDSSTGFKSYHTLFETTSDPQRTLGTGADRKTALTQEQIPVSYQYTADMTIKPITEEQQKIKQQLLQDITLPEFKQELPTLKYDIPKVTQKERISRDYQELTKQRIEQVKQPIAKPQLKKIDSTNKFLTQGIEPVPLTSKNLDITQRRYLKKIIDLNVNSNIKTLDPIDVNGKEYEIAYVETNGKLLGFIPVKSKEYYMIDPINEQVISEKKPWWDALTIS